MYAIKIHATHAVPYANTGLTAAYWTTRYTYAWSREYMDNNL